MGTKHIPMSTKIGKSVENYRDFFFQRFLESWPKTCRSPESMAFQDPFHVFVRIRSGPKFWTATSLELEEVSLSSPSCQPRARYFISARSSKNSCIATLGPERQLRVPLLGYLLSGGIKTRNCPIGRIPECDRFLSGCVFVRHPQM